MRTSEAINEIAAALAAAQAEMSFARKDSTNPHFKSKYSDLSSIIDALREPFAKHGLGFTQDPGYLEGRVTLSTRIFHKSGQWFEGELHMKPAQDTPQGVGGCITYMRRYSLQSMAGVSADDDDDGHAASKPSYQPPRAVEPPKAAAKQGPVYTAKDAAFVGWLEGELIKQDRVQYKQKVLDLMEGTPHLDNHDKAVSDALKKAMNHQI